MGLIIIIFKGKRKKKKKKKKKKEKRRKKKTGDGSTHRGSQRRPLVTCRGSLEVNLVTRPWVPFFFSNLNFIIIIVIVFIIIYK